MSDPGRLQFLWPQPGEARGDESQFELGACGQAAAAARLPRLPNNTRHAAVRCYTAPAVRACTQHARCSRSTAPPHHRGCPVLAAAPPRGDGPVLDTFCLLCLAVEEVDHIQLAANLRHRYLRQPASAAASAADALETADGEWVVQSVNP